MIQYFKDKTVLKKFFAFTLAETLIVMGIIGVVAAITIPNMSRDTNNVEKVTKFKKLYTELANAHENAVAKYGPVDEWFMNPPSGLSGWGTVTWQSERYVNRLAEFMKVTKNCKTNGLASQLEPCIAQKFTTLANDTKNAESRYAAILSSGAGIGVIIDYKNCNDYYYNSPWNATTGYNNSARITCGRIYLDIDGPKNGKNIFGIDIFSMPITKEGIKPAHFSSNVLAIELADRCTHGRSGGGACGQWIMDNDNMDYLMVKDRSSFAKSRTCPNNNVLGYDASKGEVRSCK